MIKKTVKYEDFDGNERVEDCYFNLTQTELVDVAMDLPEGFMDSLGNDPSKIDQNAAAVKMIETFGNKGIMEFIKELLLKSYGVKSEDGRRFEKSEQLSKEFSETLAFDAIFIELLSDDAAAADFINKILPAKVVNQIGAKNTAAITQINN